MIFKKIPSDRKKAKRQNIRDLANYIVDSKNDGEKVLYANDRGFLAQTHKGRVLEMIGLAEDTSRSKNPCNHYVISWQKGEKPTPANVDRAVELILEEFGLVDHQCIYGLHEDTDNMHVHIMINRMSAETGKVVEINKGFDIEAGHCAIAKIEAEQGWRPEKNSRYKFEDGKTERTGRKGKRQPSQKIVRGEKWSGEESATTIAIRDALPIIQQAKTWKELHEKLAKEDIEYQREGAGAAILVGEIKIKPSAVDRDIGFQRLVKRLGPFVPKSDFVEIKRQRPKRLKYMSEELNDLLIAETAIEARRAVQKARKADNAYIAGLGELNQKAIRERHQAEYEELVKAQMSERLQILDVLEDEGRSSEFNHIAARLDELQLKERDELRVAHTEEANTVRVLRGEKRKPRPIPEGVENIQYYEDEYIRDVRDELPPRRAYRYKTQPGDSAGGMISAGPARYANESFEARAERRKTQRKNVQAETFAQFRAWKAKDGRIFYYRAEYRDGGDGRRHSFIDCGDKIGLTEIEKDAIRAALELGVKKWGEAYVNGSKEFIDQVIEIAARDPRIVIANSELQIRIQQRRAQLDGTQQQATQLISRMRERRECDELRERDYEAPTHYDQERGG